MLVNLKTSILSSWMSVYCQMGCVYRCFLQLNFRFIILLFSGSPAIKDCNHLKMDHYFSPSPSLGSIDDWRCFIQCGTSQGTTVQFRSGFLFSFRSIVKLILFKISWSFFEKTSNFFKVRIVIRFCELLSNLSIVFD